MIVHVNYNHVKNKCDQLNSIKYPHGFLDTIFTKRKNSLRKWQILGLDKKMYIVNSNIGKVISKDLRRPQK